MKKEKTTIMRPQSRVDSRFVRVLTMLAMMLLFLTTGATSAMADPVDGDVNGDDVCDIADVAAVISVMQSGTYAATADVNGDAVVDVGDIDQIYNIMLLQSASAPSGEKVPVLKANAITANGEGKANLVIDMDFNTTETLVGLAFVLTLPDGVDIDSKKASVSSKRDACSLGTDMWDEDVSGWLTIRQNSNGFLFAFIDQDDRTPLDNTQANVITIPLKGLPAIAATGTISMISMSNDQDQNFTTFVGDNKGIANVTFGINQENPAPAPAGYSVTMPQDTPDATLWTAKAGTDGTYQALPLEGVAAGTAVTVKYDGTKRVKSVKAVKKSADKGKSLAEATVGMIIGSNGKAYEADDKDNLPSGVTTVAKVCYVDGNGHGLAMALADEGKMNWTTAQSTCAAHTPAITGGTWKLATKDEWQQMINAVGSYNNLKSGFSSVGGTNLQSDGYWTNTEFESDDHQMAYLYYFNSNRLNKAWKTNSIFVRACLAW